MRHGEGTLLHADGSIFRGHFWRDKKTGRGTVTSLDGSCYEGKQQHVYGIAENMYQVFIDTGELV